MSGASPRRRARRALLPLIAFSLLAGLLSDAPAVAHTFTKTDQNDSKGKLDIKSVTVSHTVTGAVVYRFVTYDGWKAKDLGKDSFFIIQIDNNNDRHYERCAFIFFGGGKLRGSLTNCGNNFVRGLKVAKLSGTTAKITIPKPSLQSVYRWAGASVWNGPAPCANTCVDFAPNNFPDILHDLLPPVLTLDNTAMRIWDNSTSSTFNFPFQVTDANVGMKSWKVQSRALGGTTWTTEAQGIGGGSKNPAVDAAAGQYTFRVVAADKQANTTIKSRPVHIPIDDTALPSSEFSVTPATTPDLTAFGGSYSLMAATTVFTHPWTPPPGCLFELIGPGSDSGLTWNITVSPSSGSPSTFDQTAVPAGPRQVVYSDTSCSTTYTVTVNSGSFGLDAVLG